MIYKQRKRIRRPNYDYAREGAYFLTICTHGMLRLFGTVENAAMILNDAGLMVQQKWIDMQKFYPGIKTEAFCVMPNHLHAIVRLNGDGRDFPTDGTPQGAFPTMGIPEYMHRFKSLTTRLYINGVRKGSYLPFDRQVWQKSYHDHIIRDENEYKKIFFYIKTTAHIS